MHRAILAFYRATIIPIVRWSCIRAGFRLNPEDRLPPLTVTRTEMPERIVLPELSMEEFVFPVADEAIRAAER
jgi:hypothetical protein